MEQEKQGVKVRKTSEARLNANRRYCAKSTRLYAIRLHNVHDAEIIRALDEVENKADFIRKAIRYYIAHEHE